MAINKIGSVVNCLLDRNVFKSCMTVVKIVQYCSACMGLLSDTSSCGLRMRVSDSDMYLGTSVTHVPWCIPGSLTSGFLWSRWRVKRSRHSRRMRNPEFYVSGKRPIAAERWVLLIYEHSPDSKDHRIAVDYTSIRRFRVGSMSNRRRSEGLCYPDKVSWDSAGSTRPFWRMMSDKRSLTMEHLVS